MWWFQIFYGWIYDELNMHIISCLLYTSDAADES